MAGIASRTKVPLASWPPGPSVTGLLNPVPAQQTRLLLAQGDVAAGPRVKLVVSAGTARWCCAAGWAPKPCRRPAVVRARTARSEEGILIPNGQWCFQSRYVRRVADGRVAASALAPAVRRRAGRTRAGQILMPLRTPRSGDG